VEVVSVEAPARLVLPPIDTPPGVELTVGALEAQPDDWASWARDVLDEDGAPWVLVEAEDTASGAGWPLSIFVTDVVEPSTGEVCARRLHAIYRFHLDWAVVVLRGPDRDRFAEALPAVKDALLRGTIASAPDRVCALADLFAGLDEECTTDPADHAATNND
jgi:hypothetical protein